MDVKDVGVTLKVEDTTASFGNLQLSKADEDNMDTIDSAVPSTSSGAGIPGTSRSKNTAGPRKAKATRLMAKNSAPIQPRAKTLKAKATRSKKSASTSRLRDPTVVANDDIRKQLNALIENHIGLTSFS